MRVRIRQDGEKVILIFDGQFDVVLHWDAALALAREIQAQAKRAEEIASREQVIGDAAFALRAGLPFALTDQPHLQREAVNEALYNKKLRLHLPGKDVRDGFRFGVGQLRKRPPKESK